MTGYQVTFENLDSQPRPARSPHVVRVPAASQEEAVQKAKKCVHDTDRSIRLGEVLEMVELPEDRDTSFVNRGFPG